MMRLMCEKGAKTSKIPEYIKTKEWQFGNGCKEDRCSDVRGARYMTI